MKSRDRRREGKGVEGGRGEKREKTDILREET
jgi:hypothetical protein